MISIIVPVYNSEKYLDACLSSIISQSYKDIEIIIVDDGSSDGSPLICDAWAERDQRVRVIHKKDNEGLGFARNTGMDAAKGDYYMFVDSDDLLCEKACEKALAAIEESRADLCYFGYIEDFSDYDDRPRVFRYPLIKTELYEGQEVVDHFFADTLSQRPGQSGRPYFDMSAWSTICRAQSVKASKARFLSEREYLNEDLPFRAVLCRYAARVRVMDDVLYIYMRRRGSITTGYRKDRFEASFRLYIRLRDQVLKGLSEEIYDRLYRFLLNNVVIGFKQAVGHTKELGFKAALWDIRSICENEAVAEAIDRYRLEKLPAGLRLLFLMVRHKLILPVYFLTLIRMMNK